MKIETYSIRRLDEFAHQDPDSGLFVPPFGTAVVSMIDHGNPPAFVQDQRVLSICFGDHELVDFSEVDTYREFGMVPFQLHHALEIENFILRCHRDPDISRLCIHCTYGISRSGAVAVFAAQLLHHNLADLVRANPHISPNLWMLQLFGVDELLWEQAKIEAWAPKVPERQEEGKGLVRFLKGLFSG